MPPAVIVLHCVLVHMSWCLVSCVCMCVVFCVLCVDAAFMVTFHKQICLSPVEKCGLFDTVCVCVCVCVCDEKQQ